MIQKDYYSAFRLPVYSRFGTIFTANEVGLFDPMNFVIKLTAEVYEALMAHRNTGRWLVSGNDPIMASQFTYWHELLHWWQHIGTTAGLINGLCIPVQSLINGNEFKSIAQDNHLEKPLIEYTLKIKETSPEVNVIVNNFFDSEFAYGFLRYPQQFGREIINDKFFLTLDHAIGVHYANTIGVLGTDFDHNFAGLPNPREWPEKILSFGRSSENQILMPPIGMNEIQEGQARFCEIQLRYLCDQSKSLSWNDFRQYGLLQEDYIKAFELFLQITRFEFPDTPLSQSVFMFLLLCDIALNPSCGYPDSISDYSKFATDINPGIRFCLGAIQIRKNPRLLAELSYLGGNEYDKVAQAICHPLGWRTPREVSQNITAMANLMTGINLLRQQLTDWQFGDTNVALRMIYADHLKFMEDKACFPHYFCWPSAHFTLFDYNDDIIHKTEMLSRHDAMFIGVLDGSKVATIIRSTTDEVNAVNMMDKYLGNQALYDLNRQWISKPGHFSYDYSWRRAQNDDSYDLIFKSFRHNNGVDINTIKPCI